jgi:hypothetical protein
LPGFRPRRIFEVVVPTVTFPIKDGRPDRKFETRRASPAFEEYSRKSAWRMKKLNAQFTVIEMTDVASETDRKYVTVMVDDFKFDECIRCGKTFRNLDLLNEDGYCEECWKIVTEGQDCSNASCEAKASFYLYINGSQYAICKACMEMFRAGYDAARDGAKAKIEPIVTDDDQGQNPPGPTNRGPDGPQQNDGFCGSVFDG